MVWFELTLAFVFASLFMAFHFLSGSWCEPVSVKLVAGAFVVVAGMFYLWLVDDEHRPKVGALHRIIVGGAVGLVVAAIAQGSTELYVLLMLVGVMLGYIGCRWVKHVPM